MLFVERLPPLVQFVMMSADRCRVRFEREQMRLEFFQVLPVADCAELSAMEFVEFFHQCGMSQFQSFLRRDEIVIGRPGLVGHTEASYSATDASLSQNPEQRSIGNRGYLGNLLSTSDNPHR